MKPVLGAFTYWYRMEKYDYPCVESVESILDAVDKFIICECMSDDSTPEIAKQLQEKYPDKIKVIHRPWVLHFSEISSVANFCVDHFDNSVTHVVSLQADEVIHENSLEELKNLPEIMDANNKIGARWNYTHAVGNFDTIFPFCYSSLVRVVKRNSGMVVIGDGVQFAIHSHQGDVIPEEKILNTNIQIFHYGKVGKNPEKAWQREWDFQQLFTDLGFPDKRMMEMKNKIGAKCDYLYLFKEHVVNKTIQKFTGTHPKVMVERIAKFKSSGFEQFISEMEDNLKIEWGENK